MRLTSAQRTQAFTKIEALIMVVAGTALALLGIMGGNVWHHRRQQAVCANNLRVVMPGFHEFAAEHKDRFPWRVRKPEYVGQTNVSFLFSLVSNTISPAILVCPADDRRPAASWKDWSQTPTPQRDNFISYFINLDALITRPTWIFAGDRNINANEKSPCTAYEWFTQGAQIPLPRLSAGAAWDPSILHRDRGNLLQVDGTVLFEKSTNLSKIVFPERDSSFGSHALLPNNLK